MGRWRTLLVLCGLGGLLVGLPRLLPDQVEKAHPRDQTPHSSAGDRVGSASSKSQSRDNKTAAEIPKLLATLRGGTTAQTRLALEVLLPDLMKRDIAAAAKAALDLEVWASREQVLLKIADTWAERDPDAAVNWSRNLSDAGEQQNCLATICRKLALSDPARAVALAETLPGEDNLFLLTSLSSPWMARDPDAAIEWIFKQKSSHARDLCWSGALVELAKKSPERAANLAVEEIASEPLQAEAVISVLHQWILRDRKAAADWVELFPAGPLRTRAEGELKGTH